MPTMKRLSESLVAIDGVLWTKTSARKPATCRLSGKIISKGTKVYRPSLSNKADRRHRVLASVLDQMVPT
jgi:hypothetical protein